MFTQCRLQRGSTFQTSWIPSKFAVKGKFLELRGVNGWEVISVGGTLSKEYVMELGRDYLHQRKASDI